jgi:predicted permease
MRALVWRLVERRLKRHLTPDRLLTALGDLSEDVARRDAALGSLRANLWLWREARSVAAAYRTAASGWRPTLLRADDLRLAVRRLRKAPAASLASVITLACAIGAAAVTWSVLSSTLLHPIAAADPDRIVVVGARMLLRNGQLAEPRYEHIYPALAMIREASALEDVAAAGTWTTLVAAAGEVPVDRNSTFVTTEFFKVLGLQPALGRWFTAEEDRRGAAPVAVLSHRFWMQHFGGSRAALGRELRIGNASAVVIGVAPRRFRGLALAQSPDLFLPFHTVADVINRTTNFFADATREESPTAWITILGRQRPTIGTAQTTERLNALPVETRRGYTFLLMPVETIAVPEAARAGLAQFGRLLAMTVALLLLIGCVTVGVLLLIRTEARRDELAMCLALGATRARLALGVVVEGALLCGAGTLAALPIAFALLGLLGGYRLPGGVEIGSLDLSLDAGTMLTITAAAVLATMLIAAVAVTVGVNATVADVIRARSGARFSRRGLHRALVLSQVVIAVVLASGAGLFARSLGAALRLNPGLDAERLITAPISLVPHGYSGTSGAAFFDDLRQRLGGHPAIASVSLAQPRGGMSPRGRITIDGAPRSFPTMVAYTAVDAAYFDTFGLRVVAGRTFSEADSIATPPPVIVSESFGRLLAEGGHPIGVKIAESSTRIGQTAPDVVEVVGVVPDVMTNVNVQRPLVIYYPNPDPAWPSRLLVVRARSSADEAMREIGAAVRAIDPAVTPGTVRTLQDQLLSQLAPQQLGLVVLGALGTIAVLLTVFGAYILATTMARLRAREIGIRAALGASGSQLGRLILGQTLRLVAAGLLVGVAVVWSASGAIRALLYRVEPLDLTTLASVCGLILIVSGVVCLRPALSAARVDPVRVLRQE